MGCKDQSTTYLKKLGYNVIRHPRQGVVPFGIIGKSGKAVDYLGHIQYLLTNPPASFPESQTDHAGDVNGQKTSSLSLGVGLNILGNIIGAMGGNLGVTAKYTNAKSVQFTFKDVLIDSLPLLQFGGTIRDAVLDVDNPAVEPYISDGELYLITAVIKSNKIDVEYKRDDGVEVEVKIPVVQEVVGGDVKVETAAGSQTTVTFEGAAKLGFGFKAFKIGIDEADGTITLKPAKPGSAFLADLEESDFEPVELTEDGLLNM